MLGTFMRRGVISTVCAVATIPLVTGVAAAAPATSGGAVVVVSGLNNPRQLSLLHNDVLLIAEAGKGGTVAQVTSPDGSSESLGYTGSISAVLAPASAHRQAPHRIISGLLSAANPTSGPDGPKGGGATGPDGVSALSLNDIAVIETTFGAATPAAAKGRDGHLLLTTASGQITPIADITGYEKKHDPDHMGVDSNPYSVLAYRGGWLVADAAGNDILRVRSSGRVSVFHVFPNVKTGPCATQFDPGKPFVGCNFVPTSMATDRAGHVYVGGLSSLTPGQAQVVKLNGYGHVTTVWKGFTAVDGLAVGPDGSLYVSQLTAPEAHPINPIITGVLTRIQRNGHRTNLDVPFPAGIAVDNANNVYVSAYSIAPDSGAGIPGIDTSGQVWRLRF